MDERAGNGVDSQSRELDAAFGWICQRRSTPPPSSPLCSHTSTCCREALAWQKYTHLLLPPHLKPGHFSTALQLATSSHPHAWVRCAFTGLVAGFCGLREAIVYDASVSTDMTETFSCRLFCFCSRVDLQAFLLLVLLCSWLLLVRKKLWN